jgi:N-acyl-D-amino-acid deacylase
VRAALTDMKVVEMAAQVNQEAAFFLRGHGRACLCWTPTPNGSVDYEPLLSTAWWRAPRPPAPTRWPWPTTPCWPTMASNDGKGLLYFPVFNYSYGDLSQLHTQLQHPRTMMSLADGGAHVGYVCDVSMPTFMLTHWARDRARGPKLPLEMLVKKQTRDTAEVYGLHDRGLLAPGMKADVNIIDFDRLHAGPAALCVRPARGGGA